jgi:hypothetical protein
MLYCSEKSIADLISATRSVNENCRSDHQGCRAQEKDLHLRFGGLWNGITNSLKGVAAGLYSRISI